MSNNDNIFGWLIGLATLIFVGWSSYEKGYKAANEEIFKEASILELKNLREEVERLRRNQR